MKFGKILHIPFFFLNFVFIKYGR
ncbi:hypothetical protein AM461_03765 [Providencia rettgeri]|nr:hypothetical protein AM461_03765 [Providencia rettgeri]